MDSIHNTTATDNSNLSALSPEQVLLVIKVLERTNGKDFHLDEYMLDQMKAGDGLGLLAADAATHALRRTSAWAVANHIEAFLLLATRNLPPTKVQQWAQATFAQLRSSAGLPEDPDRAEIVREKISAECNAHDADCYNPIDACLVELTRYAVWIWHTLISDFMVEESIEAQLNKSAMAIVRELAHECSRSTGWEFIDSLRTLGLH